MSEMCAIRGACARGPAGGGGAARGRGRGRCAGAGAVLVLFVYACAAATPVHAHTHERDSQLAPAPFILGSRFGRSPPRLLAPRNDKFFLSSRYGKRSELAVPPPPPPPPLPSGAPSVAAAAAAGPTLVCDYTGLGALYRCRAQRPHRDDRRLWDEASSEDE